MQLLELYYAIRFFYLEVAYAGYNCCDGRMLEACMDKALLCGVVFGAGIATAFGGFAGYRMLRAPEYAQVFSATPVTETVRPPRPERWSNRGRKPRWC